MRKLKLVNKRKNIFIAPEHFLEAIAIYKRESKVEKIRLIMADVSPISEKELKEVQIDAKNTGGNLEHYMAISGRLASRADSAFFIAKQYCMKAYAGEKPRVFPRWYELVFFPDSDQPLVDVFNDYFRHLVANQHQIDLLRRTMRGYHF